ncbi:MAG: ComF family protein [Candidatus Levybacteria bacterium]|nr:ComF family protein [Candidatus Levybacteria bacterium]
MGLLDVFFPKKCVNCGVFGAYVCPTCFIYISFDVRPICLVCNRQTYNGLTHEYCRGRYVIDGTFSSITFGKVAKRLVYRFKYKPFLKDLGEFMVDLFYEGLIQKEAFFQSLHADTLLVPIPLHRTKYRQRGYNQVDVLAKGLGKRLGLPVASLVVRIRSTKSQVNLDQKARKENIAGAFAIAPGHEGTFSVRKTIFLVDDVLTSGSTLSEAARILKKAGAAKVYGLTLAHGQ